MDLCPTVEELDAHLSGLTPFALREPTARHIDSCTRCQGEVGRLSLRFSRAEPAAARPTPDEARVGRFVLLEEGPLGRGVVRPAFDTLLERKVALRFLADPRPDRPRLDVDVGQAGASEAALARVLSEAGVIARLQHPHVARVHGVGLHEGLPYLAVELVDGISVDRWRREAPRNPREIARVMGQAARGLAAAHAEGIVHGDVQAANILVAGPRVLVTGFEVSGRAGADARADVQAFCATLFEVLHGHPPGPDHAAPPGSRVPARLHRLAVRGLDADPARPPLDLGRLADELQANPAGRRRTSWVAAGAVAVAAAAFLIAGRRASPERRCRAGAEVMGATWNDDRRAALEQRYRSAGRQSSWPSLERRLDQFAQAWKDTYGETCSASYGPRAERSSGGASVSPDQLFDRRVRCLGVERATLEAFLGALAHASPGELLTATGAVLPSLGDCQGTVAAESTPPPVDPAARARMAAVEREIARSEAEQNLGNYVAAGEAATRAVDGGRGLGQDPLLASALIRLAAVERARGSNQDAEQNTGLARARQLLEEAYGLAERGRDDHHRLIAADDLIAVQLALGQPQGAQRWVRLAQALLARLGDPPAEAAAVAVDAGALAHTLADEKTARQAWTRALELARKLVPPDPRLVVTTQARLCRLESDYDKQAACQRETLAQAEVVYGPEHPDLARFYGALATALEYNDRTRAEACAMRRKALAVQQGSRAPSHPSVVIARTNLATCLVDLRQIDEAQRQLEEALSSHPRPQERALVHESLGNLLGYHRDDLPGGAEHYREAIADYQQVFGPTHDDPLRMRNYLAAMYYDFGHTAEAHRELDRALEVYRQHGLENMRLADLYADRGATYGREKNWRAEAAALEQSISLRKRLGGEERDLANALNGLGEAKLKLGHAAEAVADLEHALALRPAGVGLAPVYRGHTAFLLAQALVARRARGDHQRACALASEAAVILRKGGYKVRLAAVLPWLARERCPSAP
jgi:tetratricopeptide (TPR) repeat protein